MNLTINIDGGSRGNPGPGAAAWVIKNPAGLVVEQGGQFFAQCTNNFAEFSALKMALQQAAKLGGARLSIFSDSQLLVRQYSGQYKIKNPDLQVIMGEIRQLARGFAGVSLTHVPREQNKAADAMCNKVMDMALKKPGSSRGTPPHLPSREREQPAEQLELFDI